MKTKVNRPNGKQHRDPIISTLIQSWYDLGYSDALKDGPDLYSKAYDRGYENGLKDGLNEENTE